MTDETLKNCPFCGGESDLSQGRMGLPPIIGHYIECVNCAGNSNMFEIPAEAIQAWNTRAKSPEYEKLLSWVKEQTRFAHHYMPNEVHSIGEEAKELLKEIGHDD